MRIALRRQRSVPLKFGKVLINAVPGQVGLVRTCPVSRLTGTYTEAMTYTPLGLDKRTLHESTAHSKNRDVWVSYRGGLISDRAVRRNGIGSVGN